MSEHLHKSIDLLENTLIMKQKEINYLRLYIKKLENHILINYDNTDNLDLDITEEEYDNSFKNNDYSEYDKNKIEYIKIKLFK